MPRIGFKERMQSQPPTEGQDQVHLTNLACTLNPQVLIFSGAMLAGIFTARFAMRVTPKLKQTVAA